MQKKDYPYAVELANSMDWNMTTKDFEFNRSLEPHGCFIAFNGEDPVGVATCISYGKIGWFGNLVVNEQHRKQGFGKKIVQHALCYLRRQGASSVGLYAYKHLIGFYEGIGFKGDVDFVVLKANPVSGEQNKLRLKILNPSNFLDAMKLDAECFGAPRGKILEPLFTNPKNFGFLFTKGSELVGFASAKMFGQTAEIGPLVCNRKDPENATKLLEAVFAKLSGFEAYIYIAASEKPLLDLAVGAGFEQQFHLTRMFCGPNIAKKCIYSAESLERG